MKRKNMIRWMAFAEGKTPSEMEFEMSAFDDDTVEKIYWSDRGSCGSTNKKIRRWILMDILVFMVVVFGGLYIYDAIKTKSLKKAAQMMFDVGDDK